MKEIRMNFQFKEHSNANQNLFCSKRVCHFFFAYAINAGISSTTIRLEENRNLFLSKCSTWSRKHSIFYNHLSSSNFHFWLMKRYNFGISALPFILFRYKNECCFSSLAYHTRKKRKKSKYYVDVCVTQFILFISRMGKHSRKKFTKFSDSIQCVICLRSLARSHTRLQQHSKL